MNPANAAGLARSAPFRVSKPSRRLRRVVMLAYPDVELLDVTGPLSVLSAATRLARGSGGYRLEVAAPRSGAVETAGGVGLVASRSYTSLGGPIDTLIVPGGLAAIGAGRVALTTLRRLAPSARRVVGVCTGAFLLAEAGLLEGRRAVTHWATCATLRRSYAGVQVEEDPIFVQDGNVWTSAGVTAGMDLALALVEQDHGSALALEVARWLVMYLRRPGGQSQHSVPLAAQTAEQGPISELLAWARAHLSDDLSVPALARRAAMSERNFARKFVAETGASPAAWILRLRLEAVRSALELSDASIKEVAAHCGFQSAESLNHAFRKAFGTTPRAYRSRFRAR